MRLKREDKTTRGADDLDPQVRSHQQNNRDRTFHNHLAHSQTLWIEVIIIERTEKSEDKSEEKSDTDREEW